MGVKVNFRHWMLCLAAIVVSGCGPNLETIRDGLSMDSSSQVRAQMVEAFKGLPQDKAKRVFDNVANKCVACDREEAASRLHSLGWMVLARPDMATELEPKYFGSCFGRRGSLGTYGVGEDSLRPIWDTMGAKGIDRYVNYVVSVKKVQPDSFYFSGDEGSGILDGAVSQLGRTAGPLFEASRQASKRVADVQGQAAKQAQAQKEATQWSPDRLSAYLASNRGRAVKIASAAFPPRKMVEAARADANANGYGFENLRKVESDFNSGALAWRAANATVDPVVGRPKIHVLLAAVEGNIQVTYYGSADIYLDPDKFVCGDGRALFNYTVTSGYVNVSGRY